MKIIFLLPDICTPQEKNFKIFWTKIIFLGSNGRMDVACAISDPGFEWYDKKSVYAKPSAVFERSWSSNSIDLTIWMG